jgi:hypothetical protein
MPLSPEGHTVLCVATELRETNRTTARPSRLAAARQRARSAKVVLAAAAVALFGIVGLVARAAHPSAGSSADTGVAPLSPPSELTNALQESDDGFSPGAIAPAQAAPSVSTHTS